MSHRTQITLTDEQYERLCRESRQTGASLAELVRRALDQAYGPGDRESAAETAHEPQGYWDEFEDGAAYVEWLRRGMGHRLARLDDRS
jgi:hypothetical protein